jgi:dihydroorotase
MTQHDQLLIFREVRAIDPSAGLDATCDVVVESGRIARVGPGAAASISTAERARAVDGTALWLLPAFVDQHVHLREPGHEYKEDVESGLAAAAAGGYAHVCAMPNTNPVNDSRAVTDFLLRRAAECEGARLHPIAAITKGLQGEQLTEMAELRDAGAVGVSDDGRCVMSSAVMRRALEYASNFGLLVIQHAEDHGLTAGTAMHEGVVSTKLGLRGAPRVAEDTMIARDLMLTSYVDARYHAAHVSTQGSVELVRDAKRRGVKVTCEVTPHHLLLTDNAVAGYDTDCKVNPPLREESDVQAVRAALADGTIDSIATDHAPHSSLEKDCEFEEAAPGIMSLELALGLVLQLVRSEQLPLARMIDALSTRPAQIMGITPPSLRVGELAELVLVDPQARWQPAAAALHSKSSNSPFMKRELTGKVLLTMAGGSVAYDGTGGRPCQ